MKSERSLRTVVVGGSSLRKEGLTEFLRSADFGSVTSVTYGQLRASRLEQGEMLLIFLYTGDDFNIAGEQIEPLRCGYPNGRLVVVADQYRPKEVAAAFAAGAHGYFVDTMNRDVFIKSIELVILGERVFPSAFMPLAPAPNGGYNAREAREGHKHLTVTPDERRSQQLSPRQKSILRCVVEGDSNKCIARKIDIAESTVKVHIKAILRKIGVHNRTQAAIWGINNENLSCPSGASDLPIPLLAESRCERTDASLIANNRVGHGVSKLDARRNKAL